MEQQNINFENFKFDAAPYIIAADSFSKQFKENNTGNLGISKDVFEELDSSISEKLNGCSKIIKDLNTIGAENLNLQMELDTMKRAEEQQTRRSFDLKSALKSASNVTFVKDNEKCSALARKIQERLGFKFKLAQCQHSQHLWTAKFFFDRNELEGNYFIMVSYDTEDELFALYDMQPKTKRFMDMKNLLEKTNDITGLLYFYWKTFMSVR